MTKTAKQFALPHDKVYSLIEVIPGCITDVDKWTFCENCGRGIVNVARIISYGFGTFNVGLDCAKTLTGIGEQADYWQSNIDRLNRFVRAVKKTQKNGTFTAVSGNAIGYWLYATDKVTNLGAFFCAIEAKELGVKFADMERILGVKILNADCQ